MDSNNKSKMFLLFLISIVNLFHTCKSENTTTNFGIEGINFYNHGPFDKFDLSMLNKYLRDFTYQYLPQSTIETLEVKKFEDVVKKNSKRITDDLNTENENYLIEKFSNSLIYLREFNKDAHRCTAEKTCPLEIKKMYYTEIVNPNSHYRRNLSSLVNDYIVKHKTPFEDKRVFDVILTKYEEKVLKNLDCNWTESVQMTIYNIFGLIMITMIQNYALITITHIIRYKEYLATNMTEAANWKSYMETFQQSLQDQVEFINHETRDALLNAPKHIRRCDPPKHVKYVTYDRLTRFIQGWVGSEEYLNVEQSCNADCAFRKTKFYDIEVPISKADKFHKNLKTNGTLYDCSVLTELNTIYQQLAPPDFERNYQYLTYEKGNRNEPIKIWGKKPVSANHQLIKYTRNDIKYSAFHFNGLCQTCLCYVDQVSMPNAIRWFSKTPAIASPGYVITGIRWVIRNQIVYLEIQEGKLGKGNSVSNPRWCIRPYEEISDAQFLDFELRSISLEDVILPEGYLATGVKFVFENNRISLSILGMDIRFSTTGNYYYEESNWYKLRFNDSSTEIILNDSDISEFAPDNTQNPVLSTSSGNFVKFQPSDFKKDAAQTTIPYLDIQEVITDPPSPISGVQIYYKGLPKFGGFCGLGLILPDIYPKLINHTIIEEEFEKLDQILKFFHHVHEEKR